MGIFETFGGGITAQLEEDGRNGYVYRAKGTGPALPVTREEADRFVRRGGMSVLLHGAVFLLAVAGAVLLNARWFPEGREAASLLVAGMLLLVICFVLYRSIRRSMLAPARALAGRRPVAPARAERAVRSPAGITPAVEPVRNGSILLTLAYGVAEIVVGLGSGLFSYVALRTVVLALAPTSGVHEPVGMIGALVIGIVVIALIDRQCRRKTGSSWLDLLSAFH